MQYCAGSAINVVVIISFLVWDKLENIIHYI